MGLRLPWSRLSKGVETTPVPGTPEVLLGGVLLQFGGRKFGRVQDRRRQGKAPLFPWRSRGWGSVGVASSSGFRRGPGRMYFEGHTRPVWSVECGVRSTE